MKHKENNKTQTANNTATVAELEAITVEAQTAQLEAELEETERIKTLKGDCVFDNTAEFQDLHSAYFAVKKLNRISSIDSGFGVLAKCKGKVTTLAEVAINTVKMDEKGRITMDYSKTENAEEKKAAQNFVRSCVFACFLADFYSGKVSSFVHRVATAPKTAELINATDRAIIEYRVAFNLAQDTELSQALRDRVGEKGITYFEASRILEDAKKALKNARRNEREYARSILLASITAKEYQYQ